MTAFRRGVVLDMADLVRIEVHEGWAKSLLAALQADPIPGFSKVSLEQVLRADHELWNLMAGRCATGVRRAGSLVPPMEKAMSELQTHHVVCMMLAPLPAGAGRGTGAAEKTAGVIHQQQYVRLDRAAQKQRHIGNI